MKQTCPISLMLMVIVMLLPGCDPKEHETYKPLECTDGNLSLSAQVWPSGYGDPFNTKRATRQRVHACVSGPTSKPALQWGFELGHNQHFASPAVADDGTIYVFGAPKQDTLPLQIGVMAFTPSGSLKWFFPVRYHTQQAEFFYESLAIGHDGTIYGGFASRDSSYTAIKPDGTLKWRYKLKLSGPFTETSAKPAIGPDGAIYGATRDTVYCFEPSGKVRWRTATETNTTFGIASSISVGRDGIYVGLLLKGIMALDFKGKKRWMHETSFESVNFSIVIDEDENLYFRTDFNNHRSIDRYGTLRWLGSTTSYMSQSILLGDYLYFGSETTLFKLHKDSNKVAKQMFIGNQMSEDSSPLCDDNGQIFIVTNNGYTVCFKNDTILWDMRGPDHNSNGIITSINSAPAMSLAGGLLFITALEPASNGYHLYHIR
ncbi:PQQ-binding-like beta-propeller repeat protein [bacterium]|nr:PQQ-binding-like beta-propeller repeat protein [bacterium]